MFIVTESIDVEDALRIDLAELLDGVTVCAQPAPDDLTPGTVCITCVGGREATPVSDEYDVVVDCWAETIEAAYALARHTRALFKSLTGRELASGRDWKPTSAQSAYPNPDPDRPTIPRATFVASAQVRGIPIH